MWRGSPSRTKASTAWSAARCWSTSPTPPTTCWRRAAGSSRKGGVLILTTPNAVKLAVRLKVLLGKELCHYRSFYASPPPDRHHKEYTLSEVRELLLEHGFRVERIFCRNTTSWRGPSRYASPGRRLLMDLLLAATHLWPTFKELIFARAEKP